MLTFCTLKDLMNVKGAFTLLSKFQYTYIHTYYKALQ